MLKLAIGRAARRLPGKGKKQIQVPIRVPTLTTNKLVHSMGKEVAVSFRLTPIRQRFDEWTSTGGRGGKMMMVATETAKGSHLQRTV